MSSISYTTIAGYPVISSQNSILSIGFKTADQVIEDRKVGDRNPLIWGTGDNGEGADEIERCYEYRTTSSVLKRRLELGGYDMATLEREFVETAAGWLETAKRAGFLDTTWCFPPLETPVLADWLDAVREIIAAGRMPNMFVPGQDLDDRPVFRMLLGREPTYDNYYVGDLNFPCRTVESFLRAVSDVVPGDAPCVLDATDVVLSGYSDEFEEREHLGEGHTALYKVFQTSLDDVHRLIALAPESDVLMRLLFANVITAVETYLADTAKRHILRSPPILRRFVEKHKDLGNGRKFAYQEIFKYMDGLHGEVKKRLDELVFHNLSNIDQVFREVFLVELAEMDKVELGRAIAIRHDIVHRNGADLAGTSHVITKLRVEELAATAYRLVASVDRQLRETFLSELDSGED